MIWYTDMSLCPLWYDIIGLFLQKSPIKETVFCKHMSFCHIIHMTWRHIVVSVSVCVCLCLSACVCVSFGLCVSVSMYLCVCMTYRHVFVSVCVCWSVCVFVYVSACLHDIKTSMIWHRDRKTWMTWHADFNYMTYRHIYHKDWMIWQKDICLQNTVSFIGLFCKKSHMMSYHNGMT